MQVREPRCCWPSLLRLPPLPSPLPHPPLRGAAGFHGGQPATAGRAELHSRCTCPSLHTTCCFHPCTTCCSAVELLPVFEYDELEFQRRWAWSSSRGLPRASVAACRSLPGTGPHFRCWLPGRQRPSTPFTLQGACACASHPSLPPGPPSWPSLPHPSPASAQQEPAGPHGQRVGVLPPQLLRAHEPLRVG